MRTFASDNCSGVAPEIMESIIAANNDHAVAYGDDTYTEEAKKLIQETLGRDAEVIFVFSGTAANTLSLKLATRSFHSILCTDCAHLQMYEVGAPVAATGCKLITVKNHDGKLVPSELEKIIVQEREWGRHNNSPKVVSITQPTEYGTVYSLSELEAIHEVCKSNDLILHMDGARIYNAAVALNTTLDMVTKHVDILSLGGTKNGLMFGEAVVIFNPTLREGALQLQKQLLQLDSKMRYLSAQFIPLFKQSLWKKYATQTNKQCSYLAQSLEKIPGYTFAYPVQTNLIFTTIPENVVHELQTRYSFTYPYKFCDQQVDIARLVTSFDTTTSELDDFIHTAQADSE